MKKVFIAILAAITLNAYGMEDNDTTTLQFAETSDVHGCFFPYDFINRTPMKGSLARVKTYMDNLRANYEKENVYLLDNGDILQGQPICYYYNFVASEQPNIAAQCLNYLQYDALGFGNHDIETGHSVYDKWVKECHAPVLGANIISKATGEAYTLPYQVFCKDGKIKVAVVGMLTPAIPNWLKEGLWSGLRFDDIVESTRQTVKVLREKERPDVIIGLFHSGWDGGIKTQDYCEDEVKMVAEQVDGFDVIFFGHDHTPHNSIVLNCTGKEVLCLNPANNARYVALATLKLAKTNGQWKVVSKESQLADVTILQPDDDYMRHFSDAISEVKAWAAQPLGIFEQSISTRDCYFGSSAFNDLILNLELQITQADIAFNAPLSLNASIKAGEVTVADMFNLYKFENQLYVMRLTGEEIRRHLEMSYDLWVNTMQSADDHLLLLSNTHNDAQRMGFKNFTFNFDSAAGIDYEVDVTKPNGQKVRILRMSDGRPFDPKAWYKVAVNSYRGNGGGELLTKGAGISRDSLQSRILWESPRDQRYYLMEEIKRMGTLNPQPNNNWRFVPEAWAKPAAERDYNLLFGKH